MCQAPGGRSLMRPHVHSRLLIRLTIASRIFKFVLLYLFVLFAPCCTFMLVWEIKKVEEGNSSSTHQLVHDLRKSDKAQKYKKCEKYKYARAGEDGER